MAPLVDTREPFNNTCVAPLVCQDSVEEPPLKNEAGLAVKY
jgi:hypothetical protein